MITLPVQITVIHAQGGARGDFVAGWLGLLPQYLQNYWTIDCETGQSTSNANFLKHFPPTPEENDLEKFLLGHNFVLDSDSFLRISATTHTADISRFFPSTKRNCVQLISIQISQSDILEIEWNFFVKTFLTRHRQLTDHSENIRYGVDHYLPQGTAISDRDRLEKIDTFLRDRIPGIDTVIAADVMLPYREIFQPGGSRILCDALDLVCSDVYHARWDTMITLAHSPLIIERFGRLFTFADFKRNLKI